MAYSLVYGVVWTDKLRDPKNAEILKSIWLKKLSKYKPEIIDSAIEKSLDNRYPELSVVIEICEQLQNSARYKDFNNTDHTSSAGPKFHPNGAEPSPLLAEYMRNNPHIGKGGKAEFDELLKKMKDKMYVRFKE